MSEIRPDQPSLSPDLRAFFVADYGGGDTFARSASTESLRARCQELPSEECAALLFGLVAEAPHNPEGWRQAGVKVPEEHDPITSIMAAIGDVASRDEETANGLIDMFNASMAAKITPDGLRIFAVRAWNTSSAHPRAIARILQFSNQHLTEPLTDLFGARMPSLRDGADINSSLAFAESVAETLGELGEAELGAAIRSKISSEVEARQEQLLERYTRQVKKEILEYRSLRRQNPSVYWDIKASIDRLHEAHPAAAINLGMTLAEVVSKGVFTDVTDGGNPPTESLIAADAARVFDEALSWLREGEATPEQLEQMGVKALLINEIEQRCILAAEQESYDQNMDLLAELVDINRKESGIRTSHEDYRKMVTKNALHQEQLGYRPSPLPAEVRDFAIVRAWPQVFYSNLHEAARHLHEAFGIPKKVVQRCLEQHAAVDVNSDVQLRISQY